MTSPRFGDRLRVLPLRSTRADHGLWKRERERREKGNHLFIHNENSLKSIYPLVLHYQLVMPLCMGNY
jgi:hypothetical protein